MFIYIYQIMALRSTSVLNKGVPITFVDNASKKYSIFLFFAEDFF